MKYALFLALLLAGCGGGGGGGAVPSPILPQAAGPAPQPAPIIYAALGDSITAGAAATDVAHQYPSLVAAALGAQLINLGVGGETAVPTNMLLEDRTPPLQVIYGGVLADEVSQIPANANLVSVNIGTNDLWFASIPTTLNGANPSAGIPNATTAFAAALQAIVSGVRARVPQARIILVTVPNATWMTESSDPQPLKTDVSNMDDAMRAAAIATGLSIADVHCDPAMYVPANFPLGDVHPGNAGHAAIAADILAAINHPSAPQPCAYDAVGP